MAHAQTLIDKALLAFEIRFSALREGSQAFCEVSTLCAGNFTMAQTWFIKLTGGNLVQRLFGFDDRKLIKIRLSESVSTLPEFENISGVEVVSHENKAIVLAFATEQGLNEFESRLTSLARNGTTTRKELLYAIENFENWTAEDRTGTALREQGFPESDRFLLDVELWPQERKDQRQAEFAAFKTWLKVNLIELHDDILQPSLVMARVRCNREQADLLLR